MDALTEGQMAALLNLSRKDAGEEVDWISIADARALTELGLAERTAEGWRISEAGRRAVPTAGPRDRRPDRNPA